MHKAVEQAIKLAKQKGATDCEVMLSQSVGQSISARKGDVETVEFNREKGMGITVYIDDKKGVAGCSDTSEDAIAETVQKAIDIASVTQADPCNGLPEKSKLATEFKDLQVYFDSDVNTQAAIDMAIEIEKLSLAQDKRIKQCDGAHVNLHTGETTYGNSLGFIQTRKGSRYGVSTVLIAENENGMQRDYWYDSKRDINDLISLESLAQRAATRTVQRLGAKAIPTKAVPVIFDSSIASGLISHFISAVSGGALYRKASFLCDSIGQQIFPEHMTLHENPFLPKGMGSCNFDAEGVAVKARDIVKDGVLQGYVLSSYSARRLGLETTGNAGGVHNLSLTHSDKDLFGLFKEMGTGFYVTELMGQGVNIITGDYSRGAAGFWIENGEVQFPVEGVTIASNLKDMFKNIVTVGNDVDKRGNIMSGSVLIDQMMVAGN